MNANAGAAVAATNSSATTRVWGVAEYTDQVAEGEVAPEDFLERISIPGVPGGAEAREDFEGWTAGAVRAGIEAIARETNEDPAELLEVTTAAKRAIIGKEQAAERVKQDLEKMSRERLLPRVEILEKVACYEAHLCRQLYKAMHELEALQARRLGGSAPLARLDVEGLTES
jgi:hypothetical protein